MDFTYDGQYGFHPLLISLANTGEPLFLFLIWSGNRPSQELADVYLDRAVTLLPPGWLPQDPSARRYENLPKPGIWIAGTTRATSVSSSDTCRGMAIPLEGESRRASGRGVQPSETTCNGTRSKPLPARSSGAGCSKRSSGNEGTGNGSTCSRRWSRSSEYRPVACKKSLSDDPSSAKRVGIDKGQMRLFEEYRYFFYITNDRKDDGTRKSCSPANDLLRPGKLDPAQLKNGCSHARWTGTPWTTW